MHFMCGNVTDTIQIYVSLCSWSPVMPDQLESGQSIDASLLLMKFTIRQQLAWIVWGFFHRIASFYNIFGFRRGQV